MSTNFAISPLTLDFVLNLMFIGSTKSTFTEMKNGLEYPNNFNLSLIEKNLEKWSKNVRKINGVEVGKSGF